MNEYREKKLKDLMPGLNGLGLFHYEDPGPWSEPHLKAESVCGYSVKILYRMLKYQVYLCSSDNMAVVCKSKREDEVLLAVKALGLPNIAPA